MTEDVSYHCGRAAKSVELSRDEKNMITMLDLDDSVYVGILLFPQRLTFIDIDANYEERWRNFKELVYIHVSGLPGQ